MNEFFGYEVLEIKKLAKKGMIWWWRFMYSINIKRRWSATGPIVRSGRPR